MKQPTQEAPKYRTRLERWMRENRYSDPAFAKKIGESQGLDGFSANTVSKWRRGAAVPRPRTANMKAVTDVTGITYLQMVEDWQAVNKRIAS